MSFTPNEHECLVGCTLLDMVNDVHITNEHGVFDAAYFALLEHGQRTEHFVMYKNPPSACPADPLLLRIHSACITSEVFHDERCDCRWQLHFALEKIAQSGSGMVIYHLNHEGRGAGLATKIKSFTLMDSKQVSSAESFRMLGAKVDSRTYAASIFILKYFNVHDVNLMTNNPAKIRYLEHNGITVHMTIPIVMDREHGNLIEYYRNKHLEMGCNIASNWRNS